MTSALPQIEKIVWLTLENRSLDHMLGWLYNGQQLPPTRLFPSTSTPSFDGITANAANYVGTTRYAPAKGTHNRPQSRTLQLLLDGMDDTGDLSCGHRSAFSQPFHFPRHNGKTLPGFTGQGRFNRSVEGQHAGTVGNVANELHDLANFLRAFPEGFDPYSRFLHLDLHALHGCQWYFALPWLPVWHSPRIARPPW